MKEPVSAHFLSAHVALSSTPDEWDKVAHGTLSAEEAAARLRGVEPSELVERSKRLFEPPSEERRDAMADELLAEMKLDRSGSKVSSLRSGRWIATTVLVLAAVLLLVWQLGPSSLSVPYELELEQNISSMRGADAPDDEALPTFLLEGPLLVRLSPRQPVDAVEVVAFARSTEGGIRRLDIEPRISEQGVVVVSGMVRELGLAPGRWELIFVLGTPGSLPSEWAEVERAQHEIVRTQLRVVVDPREVHH